MNPITVLAALVASTVALAPADHLGLDEGECGLFAANIDYESEPVDSPFVPTPPPEEWEAQVVIECRDYDVGTTAANRREVHTDGVWMLDENSVDDIPDTVLDVLRQIVTLADKGSGGGGGGGTPIIPPGNLD